MPNEDKKILKNNHGEKSLNVPAIIYANLECLLEKMLSCQIALKNHMQRKKTNNTSSGYSLFANVHFSKVKIVWKVLRRLKRTCNENN